MNFRFYIVTDNGLRRLPVSVMNERAVVPQLAGARQKAIQAMYEGKAHRLVLNLRGFYYSFNDQGLLYVPHEQFARVGKVVTASGDVERERIKSPKVANFELHRRANELRNQMIELDQWIPSPVDRDAIAADLMGAARPKGSSPIPILKTAPLKR